MDGMILVAATALALGDIGWPAMDWEPTWKVARLRLAWTCLVFAIALIPIRLRRPRPGRDDLWRQPGWVACSSVAIAGAALALDRCLWIPLFLIKHGGSVVNWSRMSLNGSLNEFLPMQPMLIVVAAWGVLALGGRWRAESGWVDRLGRLIGLGWIALNLADWLASWLRWW